MIRFTCILVLAVVSFAANSQAPTSALNNWHADEEVIKEVLLLRIKELERVTPFRFNPGWVPKVSLEWGLGGRGSKGFAGEYRVDTQTIHFPIAMTYDFSRDHKIAFRLIDPNLLAKEHAFSSNADHELGHALVDQVSRRTGNGPWITLKRFYALSQERQLGYNIISEGIGVYFERVFAPSDVKGTSFEFFPETQAEVYPHAFERIAYGGGYTLVRDILDRYGERGMVWLIRHPFTAGDGMRAAAIRYHERALKELAQSK